MQRNEVGESDTEASAKDDDEKNPSGEQDDGEPDGGVENNSYEGCFGTCPFVWAFEASDFGGKHKSDTSKPDEDEGEGDAHDDEIAVEKKSEVVEYFKYARKHWGDHAWRDCGDQDGRFGWADVPGKVLGVVCVGVATAFWAGVEVVLGEGDAGEVIAAVFAVGVFGVVWAWRFIHRGR